MSTTRYKAYSKASHTVAKTRQVVMLYDGIIRFMSQAKEAMEKNEIERRFKTLSRASEIIAGLQACLDHDAGGETANVLSDFYSAIDMRIFQLHRTNDAAECQALIEELKSMREVWNGIDHGNQPQDAEKPAEPDGGVQPVIVSA